MSKGIDSLNLKNRHKMQKETTARANVGAGPNDLPSSTPDLQGSTEAIFEDKQ